MKNLGSGNEVLRNDLLYTRSRFFKLGGGVESCIRLQKRFDRSVGLLETRTERGPLSRK